MTTSPSKAVKYKALAQRHCAGLTRDRANCAATMQQGTGWPLSPLDAAHLGWGFGVVYRFRSQA